jgi:small-conductance mechanosensitive channel
MISLQIDPSLYDMLLRAGIAVACILAGWFVFWFMRFIHRKTAKRGKFRIVPEIMQRLSWPIFILIAVEGLYFAFKDLIQPEAWQQQVNKINITVIIVIATFVIVQWSIVLFNGYMHVQGLKKKALDEGLTVFIRRIIMVFIYAVGLLVLLDYIGVSISGLIAGLGIGGLAVALALQPTLGNFFAGSQVVSDHAIHIGDFIELDSGTRGYVVDIGWRSTRVRTTFNNIVIIPNSKLADSIITNYYGPTMEMAVQVDVGVSYDSDLAHVQRVALEVVHEVIDELPEAVKTRDPWFGYEEFGDSNINLWVWVYAIDRLATFKVKTEIIKRLHARFNKEGIIINYPVRRVIHDQPIEIRSMSDSDNT